MDGKKFLDNYYMGIDTKSKKPILLTVEQMLVILNTYKRVLDEKKEKQTRKHISISKEKNLHTQDEIFCDWFECPCCENTDIQYEDQYCSGCGVKLLWKK